MKIRKMRIFALATVAAMVLAIAPAALATGYQIEPLQGERQDGEGYVPPNVAIRQAKLPLVQPEKWAVLFVAPEKDANMATIQPSEYKMRYLGAEGDYYRCLTFEGKVVYIKKGDAKRSTQRVDYARYPADSYAVGRNVELEAPVQEVTQDANSISMHQVSLGRYETRPWDEPTLEQSRYYVKADKGKQATVTIYDDADGKKAIDIIKTPGEIVHVESWQTVKVENGSLYNYLLAPAAAIQADVEAHPELYSPGTGTPYDPSEDYAWTDDLGIVMLT